MNSTTERTAAQSTRPDPAWAWAPFSPNASHPWTLPLAGHLYRRAAFGGTWDELQRALVDGPEKTVERLLRPAGDAAAFNQAQDAYELDAADAPDGPPGWWLRRMLETPHPLLEQMTLFWHNHFAITLARVERPKWMCRYLSLLRGHALGRFDELLPAVLAEPAVLVCHNARSNHKDRPNGDLARALLEQYTVGPDQFTAADLQAVARALTGWFVSQEELRYAAREHDAGSKRLFGQEGEFERKDVLRLVLAQPATARHVTRRLYRWFISETALPSDELLAPLASDFAKDFDTGRLVERILKSNQFYASTGQKVKSPVELVVSLLRPFGGRASTLRLAHDLTGLGQDLMRPPTVRGWAGGRAWINRFTLLGRAKLVQALFAEDGPYGAKLDPLDEAARHGQTTPEAAGKFLFGLLLQDEFPGSSAKAGEAATRPSACELRASYLEQAARAGQVTPGELAATLRQLAAAMTALPEFQMA